MVRRYLPRLRQNRSAATLETQALDRFQNQLESLMTQFARQFADNLQALQKDAMRSVEDSNGNSPAGLDGYGAAEARLLLNTVDLLAGQPRVKTSTTESQRSVNANQEFRLSHSQALAEAASTLQSSNKNS